MPRRYFNWKLASVCVIALVVLGVTAYGLRQWQRSRRAERGLVLGNKAYNEHNWEDAAKNLGRYIAVVQDDVTALLKYADAQLNIRPLKRNNVQQAVAAYRTVLRVDEANAEAAVKLTEIYLGMGMPGEAELIAKRQLEANQDLQLRRMLAVALAAQRKFDEAEAELKGIITEYPEQILAYEILGRLIEQRREDFLTAPEHWFNQAVENNPSSALAYIIRAGFHLRSKNRAGALADMEQAEKQDLSDSVVRLRLAGELIKADMLDKAEEQLVAVQTTEPTSQALWQSWAQLALKSNSKALMLKIAETGLRELSPQPWDFMPTAAELYIRCDELDNAGDCIAKLRQKDVAPATTAFLEGLIADKKGLGYEAVKCWRKALQLGAKSARTQLALAATLSRLGDKQSAIQQLRTLVSEQPNLLSARLNLARLLAEIGNWAEAVEQARMAMQISPRSLNAALFYIQARTQLLAENQTDRDSPLWQDIEGRLARLQEVFDDELVVKRLKLKLAIHRRQFGKANQLLSEIKDSTTPQVEIAMADVELLSAQDKPDEAILKSYDAVRAFPESVGPVRYLAVLLAAQDRRQECEKIIKDALTRLEQPADKRQLALLLAGLYNRWNQQEKRYQFLNTLVNDLPSDISIQRELLQCEKVIKDRNRAQQIVNRIKSLEGEDGWQWRYEQARIWFRTEDFNDRYPEIIALLKDNLLTNPDDQASRMLLAHSYERAGELRLAISTYNEALNRSPRDIRIIVPAVAALYKANEYDRADEILHQAAGEKLSHPELKKLELQSYLKRGELGSASDILEDLLTNDPNNRSVCLALALLKIRQNSFTEADELLSRLKIQEPNSLPVTVAQIELNVRQNRPDEALLLCDELVNNFNNASAYILRARTHATLGQIEKAQKDFEHAAVTEPNNVDVWTAKSDFYRSTDQLDEAVTDIQKAMSVAADNLAVQKRAISLFLASDDLATVRRGKDILDEALTTNPDDLDLLVYKARSLLAEGTAPAIGQATTILQKVTQDRPETSAAWLLLAEVALRQEKSARAIDVALRGLAHRPDNKPLLLLKARAEAAISPVLAIPTLKALRELNPNDTDAVIQLADTYLAADQSEKAVGLLKTQLARGSSTPDERKISIALAIALHKNDNEQASQEIFDLLYQSDPDDPAPLLAQARLLKDNKRWDQISQMVSNWCRDYPEDVRTPIIIAGTLAAAEDSQPQKIAESILKEVLANDSDCTEAMSVLAMLLQTVGRFAESAELYQRILALQPDDVIAINNLAWIMCEEQGKYQQALELAQRGLSKMPDYVDLIDTRGVAYYRLGEFDKAVQDFNRCLKLYPDGAPLAVASYLHLGRALAGLGQKDEAIESLKKALELNTEIGGLSAADFAEARRLLEELSQGV